MPTKKECEKIVDDVLDWAKGETDRLPDIPFMNEQKIAKDEIEKNRELVKKAVCDKYADKPDKPTK